jgi:hypothetical protein
LLVASLLLSLFSSSNNQTRALPIQALEIIIATVYETGEVVDSLLPTHPS